MITIDPKLEAWLHERAKSAGVTTDAYLERLLYSDLAAEEELESVALEGLNSGAASVVGSEFWEEKHRLLDERLRSGPGS